MKLLASNIELLSRGIAIKDLPKNFRDAITITRRLGVRYLRIDSLCIIQDSNADWERDSKKMGELYQNAILTIAAATAETSTTGILTTFKPKDEDPAIEFRLKFQRASVEVESVCLSRRDEFEAYLAELLARGPLASRGWALQERVL